MLIRLSWYILPFSMKQIKNFDDLLAYIGTGRWNIIYFIAAGYWFLVWPGYLYSFVYMAPPLNYTCRTPANTNVSEDSCSYSRMTEDGEEVLESCTEWDFDTSVFTNTLTSEFQLVCGRAYLRATFHSIYNFGSITTCIAWGYLADRYGRKKVLVVSSIAIAVILNLQSVIPVFSVILALRMLLGVMSNTTLYSLAMEVCQIKHRPAVGVLIGLPWAFGTMAWGGMGYLIRDWRYLNAAISLPFFLLFIFIYLIDESPRWLLVTGRKDEALRVMARASRLNQVALAPEEDVMGLLEKTPKPVPAVRPRTRSGIQFRWPRLLSTPALRRVNFIMVAVHLITALVFSGLGLSGEIFSADPFLYMVICGVVELPAGIFAAKIASRFGRKVPLMVGYFVCGVCMLALVCIPPDLSWLVLTLAMVGKIMVSGTFMVILVYIAEVTPTELRLQNKGIAGMSTSVAYAIVPYITDLLGMVVSWLPSVIFGVTSLAVCVMLAILPETHDVPLVETVDDLTNLWGRKWTWSPAANERTTTKC